MPRYKVEVDVMLCQGHGVCTEECPEVFEVVDTKSGYPKVRLKTRYPDEALNSKLKDAVEFCPNRTITLVEVE